MEMVCHCTALFSCQPLAPSARNRPRSGFDFRQSELHRLRCARFRLTAKRLIATSALNLASEPHSLL